MPRQANPVNWTALAIGSVVVLGGAGAVAYFATKRTKVPKVIDREVTQAEIDAVKLELPTPPQPPVAPAASDSAAPKPKASQASQGRLSGLKLRAELEQVGVFFDSDLPLVNDGAFFAPFDDKQYSVATTSEVSPREFVSFRAGLSPARNGYSFKVTAVGADSPKIVMVTAPQVPDVFVYEGTTEPGFTLLDSSIDALQPGDLLAEYDGYRAGESKPALTLRLYFQGKGSLQ